MPEVRACRCHETYYAGGRRKFADFLKSLVNKRSLTVAALIGDAIFDRNRAATVRERLRSINTLAAASQDHPDATLGVQSIGPGPVDFAQIGRPFGTVQEHVIQTAIVEPI